MKKGEKPPEMEAFERAFGRGSQGMPGVNRQSTPSGGMRPSGTTSSFSTRASGQSAPSRPLGATGSMRPLSGSQSSGRIAGGGWEQDGWLEDEDVAAPAAGGPATRGQSAAKLAPVVRDRFSTVLVRLVLLLAAFAAAGSLQFHSQKNYAYVPQHSTSAPETAVGILSLSYDAGWPLPYAHIALQAPSRPPSLSNLSPTPTPRDIQPLPLLADVLVLAVPFWILLEAVWLFWSIVLSHFGPRKPLRRFIAVGFTGLPATLWVLGGLAAGGYLSWTTSPEVTPSEWPKVAWIALAPVVPGFNLASAVSSLLDIPRNLWWQDFGIFLLVMGLPIALLTACLYVFFCLIGRGLRPRKGRAGK